MAGRHRLLSSWQHLPFRTGGRPSPPAAAAAGICHPAIPLARRQCPFTPFQPCALFVSAWREFRSVEKSSGGRRENDGEQERRTRSEGLRRQQQGRQQRGQLWQPSLHHEGGDGGGSNHGDGYFKPRTPSATRGDSRGGDERPRYTSTDESAQALKVEHSPLKSITVASPKSQKVDGGRVGSRYCYGCGAIIVKKDDQERQTAEYGGAGGGNNNIGSIRGDGNAVSIGLRSSTGGYWQEKKEELRISQIKNWALCARCRALKRGLGRGASGMDSVEDHKLKALSPSQEMTQIFREEVSKIRSKKNAVVVLCVDAINPHGSLIRTLRNYIGGNPILLAVTRCDLLPDYVHNNWSGKKQRRMKEFFRERAEELKPAGVYLCSVVDKEGDENVIGKNSSYSNYSNDQHRGKDHCEEIFDGAYQLADDLWHHLGGRDPYIVGAANIGKSTLTDQLINDLIGLAEKNTRIFDQRKKRPRTKKEQKRARFGPKSDREKTRRRYDVIQEARVTKSSLPGTTLQNVRVPCFPDHTQALWDTPGLVLDPSLKHYPIRDLRRIRAMRPTSILPQWHKVEKKAFALLVSEKECSSSFMKDDNDEWKTDALDSSMFHTSKDKKVDYVDDDDFLPLLRIEVRLKKNKKTKDDVGPVRLVWNSILNDVLSTNVTGIEDAQSAERRRVDVMMEQKKQGKTEEEDSVALRMMSEKSIKNKVERRRAFKEQKEVEIAEIGGDKWNVLRKEERHQRYRQKFLTSLELVSEDTTKNKEERRRAFQEQKEAEIAEIGEDKYNALRKEERHQHNRQKLLTSLEQVSEDIIQPNKAMEISIEHFGSMVIIAPGLCMVRVYAPNTGINAFCHPAVVVPDQWEEYVTDDDAYDGYNEIEGAEEIYDGYNEYAGVEHIDNMDASMYWSHDFDEDFLQSDLPPSGPSLGVQRDKQRWDDFSGENVGWTFDEKPRYERGRLIDGWNPLKEPRGDKDGVNSGGGAYNQGEKASTTRW